MREITPPLWRERDTLPRLNKPSLILATAALSLLAGSSAALTPAVGFIFFTFAAAMQAVLFILDRTPVAFTTIPLSYLTALLITRSPLLSLAALLYLIPALALAFCVFCRYSCSRSVITAATALGVVLAAIAAALMLAYSTTPSELIAQAATLMREELGAMTVNTADGVVPLFNDESTELLVAYASYISPSAAILALLAASALSACALKLMLRLLGAEKQLLGDVWQLEVNVPVCVIYCATSILSFIFSTSAGMQQQYYAALNILVVFAPGPVVVGMRIIMRKLNRNGSLRLAMLWTFMFCMFILFASGIAISVFAFVGSYVTFREALRKLLPRDGGEE